jgi:fructose-1,6-bisphosphatase
MATPSKRDAKVFQIKNIDAFISSLRMECVGEVLESISVRFYGKKKMLSKLMKNEKVVESFLPSIIIEDEVDKYIFSTTVYVDDVFIRPQHIETIIQDLSVDLTDIIMMKLVDHGVLEMCWHNNDFMWRINPRKRV